MLPNLFRVLQQADQHGDELPPEAEALDPVPGHVLHDDAHVGCGRREAQLGFVIASDPAQRLGTQGVVVVVVIVVLSFDAEIRFLY